MGLFDFFKKNKAPEHQLPPGISLSPDLLPHWPQIEKSKLEYIKIEPLPCEDMGITQSKFAGPLYLPKGFAYPLDSDGNYMFPLAQINFSEVPPIKDYPERGILEFYISNGDIYGINLDDLTKQDGFRILYFEYPDEKNAETDFRFLNEINFDYMPIGPQMQLHFSRAFDYAGVSDVRFTKNFGTNFYSWTERFGDKEEAIFNELSETFSSWGSKIGGYADFTQEDPRFGHNEDWILLLQIASQGNDIMWGDYGICNFFIHPENLRKKDFSKVMYTWDCC
jgi:uncharacterized protein YwqG